MTSFTDKIKTQEEFGIEWRSDLHPEWALMIDGYYTEDLSIFLDRWKRELKICEESREFDSHKGSELRMVVRGAWKPVSDETIETLMAAHGKDS